jgi:hypothetical protein
MYLHFPLFTPCRPTRFTTSPTYKRKKIKIRGTSKMLEQTSKVSSSHKQSSYKHTSRNVGFYFNWKITLNNKHLNCNTLLTAQNTFRIQVPNLTTAELLWFMKSKFTRNAQNVLHLIQCTNGYDWTQTVAPFQTFQGGFERFDRHQKCVCKVSLHFQLELDTLEI